MISFALCIAPLPGTAPKGTASPYRKKSGRPKKVKPPEKVR